MLAALALLAVTGQAAPLDTLVLAGRTVEVRVPVETPGDPGEFIPFGDERYFVRDGDLVGRGRLDGGWADIASGYVALRPRIAEATAVWRVKAFVFTRSELRVPTPGLTRQRRITLDGRAQADVLRQLALFKVLAEVRAGGRLRVLLDVEIDPDPIRGTAEVGKPFFDAALTSDLLTPRLNAGRFEADDRVFRGPFNAAIAVFPGEASTPPLRVMDTPVTVAGYVSRANDQAGALAKTFYRAWLAQVADAMQRQGFRVPQGSDASFELGEGWVEVVKTEPPTVEELARRAAGGPRPWAEARANPFGLLPAVPAPALTGSPGLAVVGDRVYVRPQFADLVAAVLPPETRAVGLIDGNPTYVAFAATVAGEEPAFDRLGLNARRQGKPVAAAPTEESSPNMELARRQDPERGATLLVRENGNGRFGQVRLRDVEVGANQAVQVTVRSTSSEPMAVQVGEALLVLGRDDRAPLVRPAFLPNGEWQTFQMPVPPGRYGVTIHPGPAAEYERAQIEPIEYEFAALRVVPATGGPEGPRMDVPDVSAESPLLRAVAARNASAETLLTLLRDRSDLVQLNAVERARDLKDPALRDELARLAQNVNPFLAQAALEGLAALGTPEAWQMVRNVLDQGPFDWNRQIAAGLIATRAEATSAGPIGRLLNARSAQARRAAVASLARLPGDEKGLIMLTFLQETDPGVRLAVVRSADVSQELVARRLLWTMVNDPSDAVRLASAQRLLASPRAADQREAVKAARDESRGVRIAMLRSLRESAAEGRRNAARLALSDADPEVRAAAVMLLGTFDGAVTVEELGPVLDERHPLAQRALLDLADKKRVTLPEATLKALRESVDPEVAARVGGNPT